MSEAIVPQPDDIIPVPKTTAKLLPNYAKDKDRPYEGDPWERQGKHESPKAHAAFLIYLSLENRTLAETNRIYRDRNGLPPRPKQSQPCSTWSRKHRWQERAAAYDNYMTAQQVAAHRRQAVKAATKHAQQAADIQEVLMLPMNKLRERIKAKGDEFSFVDALNDEELTKLARAFAQDVPTFAKMEREALTSTSGVTVPRHELKAKGSLVRAMLENSDVRALAEKITFTVEETSDESDSALDG